jgi:hypothetical protein
MRLILALILALILSMSAAPAFAAASCAPVTTGAKILASADRSDIHQDWTGGNRVGLSWSLDLQGDEEGADGEFYIYGDLIDPRGNVVSEGVYVNVMEWECDSDE